MSSQKERLKKNIIGFLEFTNRFGKEKNLTLYFAITELIKRWQKKEFYLEFEKTSLFKKSTNLKKFITHRKSLDRFNETQFKESVILPKVLRFNHWEKNSEFDKIWDTLISSNVVSLGCHNLSDRLSISNPKKIISVRTKVSFPHYGWNEKIKEKLGGKITTVPQNDGRVKSLFDENGRCWFNHSINLIKDENEWKKYFPDEEDIKPDWADNNPQLFEVIGNGVLTDLELVSFQNLGLYHSFNYKLQDTFSFEDFSDEEIDWVSDWLDWEYISLMLVHNENNISYHYFEEEDGFVKDYRDAIDEIIEERGGKFCLPLLLPNIVSGTNQLITADGNDKERIKFILNSIQYGYLNQESIDMARDKMDERLKEHLQWKENLTKKGLFKKPKIEIKGRDIKSNLPTDEEVSKREGYVLSFLKHRFDFVKGEVQTEYKESISYQTLQRWIGI